MKTKNLVILLIAFSVFGLANLASAHNPRLVYSLDALPEKPIVINSPDISQAFYGRLKGWEEYYRFKLNASSEFYWQTLVPATKDITKDVSAELIDNDNGRVIAKLEAKDSDWKPYYEEFAGDNYFAGPSSTLMLDPGTYDIRVSNPNNEGKYVLVVGQKESFTAKEIFGTIVNLPALKTFFNSSPLSAYFNYVGLFMLGGIVGLLIIAFILGFIYRVITR
jgi:hypothetical protein